MKSSRLSFMLMLAISLTACQAQLPPNSPTQGPAKWSDYQFAGSLVVKGKLSPPESPRSATVYLADAEGTPLPGIFASGLDSQGQYTISRAPSNQTFLVVAEVTFQSGETAIFKTMARATEGILTADITQATTIATEWALQDREGALGGFNQDAFGQVVEKTYSLLTTKSTPSIRSLNDCIKALNEMAATDTYLKTAIESLKADLAATKLSLEETKQAVAYLKERLKSAEETLTYLGNAQDTAKTDIAALQSTTSSLQLTIANELKPQLNELKDKQDALSSEVYELKSKTEAELAALKEKQATIYQKLEEHKSVTQTQINEINTDLQVLYTKIDGLKETTNLKITYVKEYVAEGLGKLKGMIEDLRDDLKKETKQRKKSDDYLKSEIDKLEYALDKLSSETGYLKYAVKLLFNEVGELKADVKNLEVLEELLKLLNGKICCADCDDGDMTAIIDRVAALEARDASTEFLSFGPLGVAATRGDWVDIPSTSIVYDAPTDGRLVLMYEGATMISTGGGATQSHVRFELNGTALPESVLFVDTNQAGQWTSIGTMVVVPVVKGTNTINIQGMYTGDGPNNTINHQGKILVYTVAPDPTP